MTCCPTSEDCNPACPSSIVVETNDKCSPLYSKTEVCLDIALLETLSGLVGAIVDPLVTDLLALAPLTNIFAALGVVLTPNQLLLLQTKLVAAFASLTLSGLALGGGLIKLKLVLTVGPIKVTISLKL